tara:strand:+ start:1236 stop:3209 length:1974 start_codon:yes stop_codon:yes gene_type:complete
MKQIITAEQLLFLKRHSLVVLFICYLPHITNQPIWLLFTFIAAITYRVIADSFHYAPLPWWMRAFVVISFLFVLSSIPISSSFFISLLLTFIILKCLELNTIRDLKALILSNFLLIFSALIISQDLLMIGYMFFALFANLSLMIKLSAPEVPLRKISSKSGKQLLIIIPFSLLLFYVFPRFEPLWRIPNATKVNTSLDDKLTPGSLSGMFGDDSTVMQITFTKEPVLRGYWRGMTMSFYNGETWYTADYDAKKLNILPSLSRQRSADYEILLEPTHRKYLYYQGFVVASEPHLLFSTNHGLLRRNQSIVNKRFAYAAKVSKAPYQPLNSKEYAQSTQLPPNANPRLTAWTKNIYRQQHFNTKSFTTYLKNYIHDQPFWYSLNPPPLGFTNNQMDKFWFDTQAGYCEHYASALTFILRTAGIPARVVVGYYGGEWNPFTRAITIKQNHAHAWLEYWQEDVGWQRFDPTTFIPPSRIDSAIYNRNMMLSAQHEDMTLADFSWRARILLIRNSLKFYTERWFTYYNHHTQQHLLRNLGLQRIKSDQLLQISVTAIPVFFILLGLYYQWRQRVRLDPLIHEYHALQHSFRLFDLRIKPSDTLKQQCDSLTNKMPALSSTLNEFIKRYEQLRLIRDSENKKDNKRQTILLFRQLRIKLTEYK